MHVITPRLLVARELGHTHLSPKRVQEAVKQMVEQHWHCAYMPTPADYDRRLVFIHEGSYWYPIFRRTVDGPVELPRGEVEARTGESITCPKTGKRLGDYGLAIVDHHQLNRVVLRATNPGFAKIHNRARYAPGSTTVAIARLIELALGLRQRPQRVTDEMRLRVGYVLDEYGLHSDDLYHAVGRVRVYSRWWFSVTFTTPTNPPVPF